MAIKQQSTSMMLAGLGCSEKPDGISAKALIGEPGESFDAPQLKPREPKLTAKPKSDPDFEQVLTNSLSLASTPSKKLSPTDK